jgi:hypothetical protein
MDWTIADRGDISLNLNSCRSKPCLVVHRRCIERATRQFFEGCIAKIGKVFGTKVLDRIPGDTCKPRSEDRIIIQ